MSTHTRTPSRSAESHAVSTATRRSNNRLRVRWAAIGAAIAVTLGAGTIATVDAIQTSGERLTYVAAEPCRLIDTRPEPQFNVGPRTTPLGPTEAITVAARGAQGQCTPAQLPNDAAALALNITIPSATTNGFLTVWSIGARPNASSLNPAPGEPPTPNGVDTTLTPGGTFNVYNHAGFTHVIIDVVGHYVDHNHDDRYYSENEIDAKLLSAVVRFDGTLVRGTGAVTAADVGSGYEVVFDRDVRSCTYVATPGTPEAGAISDRAATVASRAGNNNGVFVLIYNTAGLTTDTSFHLIVVC